MDCIAVEEVDIDQDSPLRRDEFDDIADLDTSTVQEEDQEAGRSAMGAVPEEVHSLGILKEEAVQAPAHIHWEEAPVGEHKEVHTKAHIRDY